MRIDEVFGHAPGAGGFHDLFDIVGVDRDDQERVFVQMRATPVTLNPYGKVHGGAIAALCDIALGSYHALKGIPSVAMNCDVSYYRPGEPDTVLTATVIERKIGRTVSSFLVEITDDGGRHIADAMFSTFQK